MMLGAAFMHGRWTGVLLAALALFMPEVAKADEPPRTPVSADALDLFNQGKALFDQHKYEAACAKFEASYGIEAGGGTLLNLALCHEKVGRTATAWSEY